MDTLTAVRSFARPGYSPTQGRVRIFNSRYYRVTFQNVERDPRADYVGLAEGEYTELLPGKQARAARDNRLNHCNAIALHTGDVYRLTFADNWYFWKPQDALFFASTEDAEAHVQALKAEHAAQFTRWQKQLERKASTTAAEERARAEQSGIGASFLDDPAHWEKRAARQRKDAEEERIVFTKAVLWLQEYTVEVAKREQKQAA